MRNVLTSLLLASASLGPLALAARADTVTYDISFQSNNNGLPASGSYLLTLDPTQTYSNTSAGLQVLSFSDGDAISSASVFSYLNGTLYIGGAVGGTPIGSGNNDYLLKIAQFPTMPAFYEFEASSTAYYGVHDTFAGSATVLVQPNAVAPEPSSLALLGTSLLGAVGVVRKRFA